MSKKPNRKIHRRIDSPHIGLTPVFTKSKGTPYRHVIAFDNVKEMVDGYSVKREYYLHATKGYRSIRA